MQYDFYGNVSGIAAMTEEIVSKVNSCLSDYVLTTMLIGCGLFFTVRTRFVQIRCFGEGMRQVFGGFSLHGGRMRSGISSFQALSLAVAAQVGTGNIIGASGAILIGGPGAIFWMWLIAFFGMATIYAEAVLAQETRKVTPEGTVTGGPVYYIHRAFPGRFGNFLAGFFAIAITVGLGFMGCMVQSNSIGESCHNAFGIPPWSVGIVIAILAGLVFIGGLFRLAVVIEKIVPFMAVLYLLGGLAVLAVRIDCLPETFACIFRYAFSPEALLGGGLGHALKTAVSQGIKRGLFSNEAGMGSTPHAHALANVPSPHNQGVAAMIGVFIDTCVVLTMTALIIISTIYTGDGPLAKANGETYREMLASSGLNQSNLVQYAISSVSSAMIGNVFVAICLLFFAFSTILSWNLFGRLNVGYLLGKKALKVYSLLSVAVVFIGTVLRSELVWSLQDLLNQLMVVPNVIALIALSGAVARAAQKR